MKLYLLSLCLIIGNCPRFMSVFFTIKQRGLNPVATVKKALKIYIYIETGKLPTMKDLAASNG